MNSFIRKYSANTLIVSFLLLVLSLFLFLQPAASLNFIINLLGCIAILDGIIHIVSYILTPSETKSYSFELIQGILVALIGFVFVYNPQIVASFLPIIVGAWIIMEGMVKFQFSFNLKATGSNNWLMILLLSILSMIFGLIVIFNPFGTAITITALIGIFLFISQVLNIIESIYVIRKFK